MCQFDGFVVRDDSRRGLRRKKREGGREGGREGRKEGLATCSILRPLSSPLKYVPPPSNCTEGGREEGREGGRRGEEWKEHGHGSRIRDMLRGKKREGGRVGGVGGRRATTSLEGFRAMLKETTLPSLGGGMEGGREGGKEDRM